MTKRLTLILLLFSIHVSAAEIKSPIDMGNYHMLNKNYAIAVDHYVKALANLPNNDKGQQYAFISEQLAIANLKLKNYNKSVFYFDQAIASKLNTPNALFEYAKLLVVLKQYDNATAMFTKWGALSDNESKAKNYTTFISKINEQNVGHSITKTPWSTEECNELCPILHPSGGLIYTSDQPSAKNSKDNDGGAYPMNLYSISKIGDYEFSSEVAPLFSFKSGFNRGVGCLTNDGKTLYFTGNTEANIPAFSNKSTQFKLGIFVSHFDGYRWSKPETINISDSKHNYAFPALSERGDTMIFSSDAMGGEGAMDLLYSTNTNGEWSTLVNLGDKINTKGDELYPRIQFSGSKHTLYFSSDGRPGFGGLDLYQTDLQLNDSSTVSVLPLPINSSYDDFGYVTSKDGVYGYITSNRDGSDDVFSFDKIPSQPISISAPKPIQEPTTTKVVSTTQVKTDEPDTIVKTPSKASPVVQKTKPVISESKPVVQTKTEKPQTEIVKTLPVVKEQTKPVITPNINTSNSEIVEYYSLSGYYMIVYSVKNFDGFTDFRDANYPDALIVRNKTGFYHLAYFLGDSKEEALSTFNARESRFAKSWLTRFGY